MRKTVFAGIIVIITGLFFVGYVNAGGGQQQPAEPVQTQAQTPPVPAPSQQPQITAQAPTPSGTGVASPFWTGDGGRGMRLGILMPASQGLGEYQEYLPAMVQGILVSNISQYSAISVLDRVSLDRVIAETLDPTYQDDWDIVRLGQVAQVGHMLTGNIIRTSTGFSLHFNVIDTTPQANTVASFSGTATTTELHNHSAIHRASLELLTQMNVRLTARARNELSRASSQETISAQTALARGVTAERQGFEVAALSHYLQAVAIDLSLLEAETRLDNLSGNITRRNIGADIHGDVQWRNQWIARLRETEDFFTRFLRESPAYYLIYSTCMERWVIDFDREIVTVNIDLHSAPEPSWFKTINNLTATIRNGLQATGRAEAWRLNWPAQSITIPSPFFNRADTLTVVMEIINDNGNIIGRQTANITIGGWFVPQGLEQEGILVPFLQPVIRVSFPGIALSAITDNISVRVASINNIAGERVTAQFGVRVLAEHEFNNLASVIENGLRTDNLSQFDIRFNQNNNWLIGYRGTNTDITIPYGVTLIDGNSGLRNRNLVSVTIPSSVHHIGVNAFRQNQLTSVIIPSGVTSIGSNAFSENPLSRVSLSDSVTAIGSGAFLSGQLTHVTLGANVRFSSSGGDINRRMYAGIGSSSNPGNFQFVYTNNNHRAGTYTWDGRTWIFSGR